MGRARKDDRIHSNLLQFILMLDNGFTHGFKVLGPSDLHPLVRDKEIIPLVWKGVVSNRLQPRAIGSLKETRARLIELLGSEELLPVPEWWNKNFPRNTWLTEKRSASLRRFLCSRSPHVKKWWFDAAVGITSGRVITSTDQPSEVAYRYSGLFIFLYITWGVTVGQEATR